MTELDRGEDSGTDHGGGADGECYVQAVGEGMASGLDQDMSGLAGQLPGRCHGAAERVPRGRCADVKRITAVTQQALGEAAFAAEFGNGRRLKPAQAFSLLQPGCVP